MDETETQNAEIQNAEPQNAETTSAVPEQEDFAGYVSVGYGTSTASLTSSICEYIYENGRRYHAYFGPEKNLHPTDELEQDRLDLHHEIFLLLLSNRLHLAPIGPTPHRILDVGTGTGIWAIEIADAYPTASVIGTDISPIQPCWVPPNCRFEVDDAELEWTFPPEYFDFIHIRNLLQSTDSFSSLLSSAYVCTSPGGYIELAEMGTKAYADTGCNLEDFPGLTRFLELLHKAMEVLNRPAHVTEGILRELLEEAGYVGVVGETFREIERVVGGMSLVSARSGFEAYGMAPFTRILGMKKEDAEKVCRDAVRDVGDERCRVWCNFYVVYGQKPGGDEELCEGKG
ncbi:S-adenosyl-L-methionine-dependent methyltransferase [Wilcoxina mikolae CBS 423.85]|nr:S-adenosyl-L-methionine-dependent methyltransferase [Wilcoxina mikolae CBS 423.85]